jgi:predicted RNA binding protein YcfA (HicA-like mRNA interferase family)
MGKKDKLLDAIKNNPKNVKFETIKKFLEDLEYEANNSGGSHWVFRKNDMPSITIPYKRPIKAIYVKMVLKLMENSND